MTVTKTEISEKNLALVEFSFEAEAVEAEKSKAYRKNAGRFNVPGFRRGKAPRSIIEKMYGSGVFLEDAINSLINANYAEIVEAPGRPAVSAPKFDIVSYEDELLMKAEMYVKPVVGIGEYKGLEVEVVKTPVTDEAVDAEIEAVRNRQAREIDVTDRAAQNGDTALIDYEGFIDGVPFEGGKDTGHKLKLGSGSFIPGFEDQLIGRSAGDKLDVSVTFPEDYHAKDLAGKPAVFKVKIHSLTYEELPELDDDFAVEVSEFNTFAEYRADVAAKIGKSREDAADRDLTEKLDARLSDLLTGEVPEAMTDNEVDSMVRDTESRISMNGLDFKTYLQYFGMTVDQYKENARPAARTRVRSRLALEKIAELEQIEISQEDTDKEYADIASQYNMEADKVRESIPAEDVVDTLKLRRAMEIVKAAARVTYLDKEPEPEEGSADAQTADSADQK
jgi:trigger factor